MRLLAEHETHGEAEKEDLLTRAYRRMMGPLIGHALYRRLFLVGIILLLVGALAMIPLRLVVFKMLPFDNKSEFQILIDTPEGTTLESTTALATARAHCGPARCAGASGCTACCCGVRL